MSEAYESPPDVNDARSTRFNFGSDDYTSMSAEMQKEYSYYYPSDVNFVPMILEGKTNYFGWEEHMRRYLESKDLVGFIDGTLEEEEYRDQKRMDTIVKELIFGSLSEDVLATVFGLDTANEVWDSLNATYSAPSGPISIIATNDGEIQEEYPNPSDQDTAKFPIMLEGETNYREWEAQMMRHLESYDFVCFIDGTLREENPGDSKTLDRAVKESIFDSLSEDVKATVVDLDTTFDVWNKLADAYRTYPHIRMKREYPFPSDEDIAKCVSIKLVGDSNYREWEEKMIILLQNFDMFGLVDGRLKEEKYRNLKRSDAVAKAWIIGSLSEDVKATVVSLDTANEVWKKLKASYDFPRYTMVNDSTRYLPLYRAILSGDWEKTREIMRDDKGALTAKLNPEGYTLLHIAVDQYQNIQFLKSLLEEIDAAYLLSLVTNEMYTALHVAAMIGNIEAAEMLVEKNPKLLFMTDRCISLPIVGAVVNYHIPTFQYLLDACVQHIGICQKLRFDSPFEGETGCVLLNFVIDAGLLDVACELIKTYPGMARADYGTSLTTIATKGDLYYSGTEYNFYQRFVYNHVPTETNNLDGTNNLQDIENQDNSNRRNCFNYVIQKIYAKFWNVALLHVAHVKILQEEKTKHKKTIILLKYMCQEIGKLDKRIDISELYREAFHLAVVNDTPEVVEEIIGSFPQAVWTTDDGHFVTQIAIKDRCLKVHNVLLDHLTRNKYLSLTVLDQESCTFSHLAARLSPLPKLNLIPGGALQMQRELQWFKGVESFDRPQSKEQKNVKRETPIMVFRSEHMELRKEGEAWMKKTADAYTITAALIVTIVFAAAITVPGGNADSGEANYATNPSFFIFIISDAISLFTSTTSLLLFLSILTTRYREEDFLYRLPLRLILGLAMLFLSVTSMMVAFGATLYLTFGQGRAWILIPIATLTCLPIASFVTLQLPLLVELISSTYYHGIFYKDGYHRI